MYLPIILLSCLDYRLGIMQGGSHTFIAPIVAMMSVEKWKCLDSEGTGNWNGTDTDEDVWKGRMREVVLLFSQQKYYSNAPSVTYQGCSINYKKGLVSPDLKASILNKWCQTV